MRNLFCDKVGAAFLVASMLLATSARAEFYTGNELLDKLAASDTTNRAVAAGYVAGVFDTSRGALHCSPAGVTVGQVSDMAKAYLTNVPAERHNSADSLVVRMFAAVWPCEKKQKSASSHT